MSKTSGRSAPNCAWNEPTSREGGKGLGYITSALEAPLTPAEAALRPLSFADFAGQPKTVERLQVMVGAARAAATP